MELLKIIGIAIGTIAMVLLVGIPLTLYGGWALWLLWAWFAVPLGAPVLGFVHAIGVSILLGFIVNQYIPTKDDDSGNRWAFILLQPIMAVGFGYIIHAFM